MQEWSVERKTAEFRRDRGQPRALFLANSFALRLPCLHEKILSFMANACGLFEQRETFLDVRGKGRTTERRSIIPAHRWLHCRRGHVLTRDFIYGDSLFGNEWLIYRFHRVARCSSSLMQHHGASVTFNRRVPTISRTDNVFIRRHVGGYTFRSKSCLNILHGDFIIRWNNILRSEDRYNTIFTSFRSGRIVGQFTNYITKHFMRLEMSKLDSQRSENLPEKLLKLIKIIET